MDSLVGMAVALSANAVLMIEEDLQVDLPKARATGVDCMKAAGDDTVAWTRAEANSKNLAIFREVQ